MPSFAERGPCVVCGQQTSNWCSLCQGRFYCSPHLEQHQLVCIQSSVRYRYAPYHPPPHAHPYSQWRTPGASQINTIPQPAPGRVRRWFRRIRGVETVLHIAVLAVELYNELVDAIAM